MADADARREHQVRRLQDRLAKRGNPHAIVLLILVATGMAGFVASWSLRSIGLAQFMGLRYLLAVAVAYLAFLGMLGLWVLARRNRHQRSEPADTAEEVIDGTYLVVDAALDSTSSDVPAGASSGFSGGSLKLGDLGDGEGALLIVILLIVAAILAAVFASVWVLMEAPLLLAELLIDGALIVGVARRLRKAPGDRHWVSTAIKRTWVPFLVTAVAFAFVGFSLQFFVPEATTMLEALQFASR